MDQAIAAGMLIPIAESIAEVHITWCGSPLNPYDHDHNMACRASFLKINPETNS